MFICSTTDGFAGHLKEVYNSGVVNKSEGNAA